MMTSPHQNSSTDPHIRYTKQCTLYQQYTVVVPGGGSGHNRWQTSNVNHTHQTITTWTGHTNASHTNIAIYIVWQLCNRVRIGSQVWEGTWPWMQMVPPSHTALLNGKFNNHKIRLVWLSYYDISYIWYCWTPFTLTLLNQVEPSFTHCGMWSGVECGSLNWVEPGSHNPVAEVVLTRSQPC